MSKITPLSDDEIRSLAVGLDALECPAPDVEAFLSRIDQCYTMGQMAEFAESQLCSGLILLGRIIKASNKQPVKAYTQDDMEQFTLPGSEILLVDGDLTINGDFPLPSTLLVTGNLTVTGTYVDYGECSLAVLGNLTCNDIRTTGWVIVEGDVTSHNYFYGHYNDDAFECLGTLKAKAIISEEHQIEAVHYVTELKPKGDNLCGEYVFDIREEEDREFLRSIHDENMERSLKMEDIESFD